MNALTKKLIEKASEKENPVEEVKEEKSLVGKKLKIKNATIKSIKEKGFRLNRWHYQEALGILLEDPQYGKVWFKTSSKFVWDLRKGDVVSGIVECSGEGDGILWSRRPKDFVVEKKVEQKKEERFNVPPQAHYFDCNV